MSRSTDVFIPLSTRAQMANNWGADYFVSLHNNSATDYSAIGFETFIFNGSVSAEPFKLQEAIHKAIASNIGIRDRGQKRGNLAVLRESAMPAVLIEYAFISNAGDESILINKVEQLAQWTVEGIVSYAGGSLKPTPQPPKEKEDEMAQLLPDTQKKDMKNLLQRAYDEKVFSDNHTSKKTIQ